MSTSIAAAPDAVLALTATVHVSIVVIRHARSGRSWLLVPAMVLTTAPWWLSTPSGLALGLALQVLWFAACERLAVPVVAASPAAGRPPSSTPVLQSKPKFVPAEVLAVHDESDAIRTFRLARPPDFAFVAGQFLTVRVNVDGTRQARCYSISSAPESSGYLEISVRRQGLVSGALHSSVKPGSHLLIKAPAGRFVYPSEADRPLVLIAAGVGITPVISMLRHAVAAEPRRRVTLLFGVREAAEIPFEDELDVIAARHPQVRVVVSVSSGECGRHRRGRVDAALVREEVADVASSVFCLCGPSAMIDAMQTALTSLGAPAAAIHSEEFQAMAALGARDAAGSALSVPARVAFARSQCDALVAPGQTLLEAAEGAGIGIENLCRAGVCGTCRTRLVEGEVQCSSAALSADDRAAGYILPCVAWPARDCVLEA